MPDCVFERLPIELKIMAPIGTPALAQTYMEKTMPILGENVTYTIETVSGADPLVAAFASGSHDIQTLSTALNRMTPMMKLRT